MQIDLTAARKDLSRLAQGDEIVELTLRGKTVAVLYPLKLVPSLGANPETQRRLPQEIREWYGIYDPHGLHGRDKCPRRGQCPHSLPLPTRRIAISRGPPP